jgi:hypothetical protein
VEVGYYFIYVVTDDVNLATKQVHGGAPLYLPFVPYIVASSCPFLTFLVISFVAWTWPSCPCHLKLPCVITTKIISSSFIQIQ